MTYSHLRDDCLYTGISSGSNARYRVWENFTFLSLLIHLIWIDSFMHFWMQWVENDSVWQVLFSNIGGSCWTCDIRTTDCTYQLNTCNYYYCYYYYYYYYYYYLGMLIFGLDINAKFLGFSLGIVWPRLWPRVYGLGLECSGLDINHKVTHYDM